MIRRPLSCARATTCLVVLFALFVVATAPAQALTLRPDTATGPLATELLSNERTLTRYGKPKAPARIRMGPSRSARVFERLHFQTEDGYPEVYVLLRSQVTSHGTWILLRVPGRPNGRTGWVPAHAIGGIRSVYTRLVVRRGRDATLFRHGRVLFRAPVGTGARQTPTPAGNFWVREKFRARGGIYGPYAIGTADYSVLSEWPRGGVIGIHGTNQPGLIPGRPSHGCIRMRNRDIKRLYRTLPIGTPIRII